MNRRESIIKAIYGIIGIGFFTVFYTFKIEPTWVEFVKKKMPIPNLPLNLKGKTLIQISDIHIGNSVDSNYIIESFKKAQKLNPDYVVYTGDYVSYENIEQVKQLDDVLKHVVKGSSGTIGVLGNHDYGDNWADQSVANNISSVLLDAGVEVLSNQQKEFDGLNFIGFDDYWGLNFKPQKVMNQYNSSKANIVLCHNPDVCDLKVWNGYQGWILSGHTHGGQCKPPFLKPPILPVKNKNYYAGEIDLKDGRKLYVNRALGHLRHVRFNARPEITVFELDVA